MKQAQGLLLIFLLAATVGTKAQVGIGTTTPAASAMLDVSTTSKGLLPPRMTKTQRNAIAAPATGLMVWCTDCSAGGELDMYNGTGWINYKPTAIAPFGNILICGQIWMGKNLDVSTYRNGDPIPKVTDNAAWAADSTGAYCYYNNDSATYAATYGKLYNWYAVNDPRGLAPAGWHIPNDAEWNTLSTCLGGVAVAGGEMKETGNGHWNAPNPQPNVAATNNSSFIALPGGDRTEAGTFRNVGPYCSLWSATASSELSARGRTLAIYSGSIFEAGPRKKVGYSVRCVRD